MYSLAIIDDDKYFINILKERILLQFSHSFYIKTYTSVTLFLEDTDDCDLILLDIDMPEIDGISFATHYALTTSILFITSQENLVYDAFGEHIIGFIKKEDINTRLNLSLVKFIQEHNSKRFEFHTSLGDLNLLLKDIMFFRRENRKVYLYTKKSEYSLHDITLSSLKDLFTDSFIYIDKSTLVNIHNIINIKHNDILLCNGSKLSISRNRIKEVKQEILAEEMKK